jgi:mono/diheme cytochrome c family protein
MMYFDQHRGWWFDPRVYAPYNSFAELASMWPKDGESQDLIHGQILFHQHCAICHQDSGLGNPLNGCPPLVGSEWVAAPGPTRIIRMASKGLTGPIEVKGQVWNVGNNMPPVGDQLAGDEKNKAETLAAIISYVRHTFGNKTGSVSAEQVTAVRAKIRDRSLPFTAEELKTTPED